MTAKDIAQMSIDAIQRLTTEQLREALKIIGKDVNQKMRRIERAKRPVMSPAYEAQVKWAEERSRATGKQVDPHISVRGKTSRQDLMREMMRAYRYEQSKTGTYSGARKAQSEVYHYTEDTYGYEMTADGWKNYYRLKDLLGEQRGIAALGSDRIMQLITREVAENNIDLNTMSESDIESMAIDMDVTYMRGDYSQVLEDIRRKERRKRAK